MAKQFRDSSSDGHVTINGDIIETYQNANGIIILTYYNSGSLSLVIHRINKNSGVLQETLSLILHLTKDGNILGELNTS